MKKRFREINIFSMSVVDLFACAMGAFILITLILFPYYLKSDTTPCPLVGVAKKQFLLVTMSWSQLGDIDLHVIDPRGREYYFRDKRHPPSPAYLAKDNTRGPGNEIWLHPNVTPGTYKVYYKFFKNNSRTVDVKGKIITQEDIYIIPDCRLRQKDQKLKVATISVDNDLNVRVDMPNECA